MRLKKDMEEAYKVAFKIAHIAKKNNDTYKQGYYEGVFNALLWATDKRNGNSSFFLDNIDII